jgi:hypothetical protein
MESASVPVDEPRVFRCPECGQEFSRSQALGLHRRAKHGVAGTSAGSVRERNRRAESKQPGKPVFGRQWQKPVKGPSPLTKFDQTAEALRDQVLTELLLDFSPKRRLQLFELYHALRPFTE